MKNCPVLRNIEKANGSSLPPPSLRIVAIVTREREEKRGSGVHRVTCVISVEKLDNCLRFRLVNFPNFRLVVIFSRTWEHYQWSYQLQCEHYGVDQIALAAKACLLEIFFRWLATWRCVWWLIYFFNFHLR
ncbi:UNVERIFIED_CONTAM: hypothetical protein NCL1_54116 [Trichonephila clavipes]